MAAIVPKTLGRDGHQHDPKLTAIVSIKLMTGPEQSYSLSLSSYSCMLIQLKILSMHGRQGQSHDKNTGVPQLARAIILVL